MMVALEKVTGNIWTLRLVPVLGLVPRLDDRLKVSWMDGLVRFARYVRETLVAVEPAVSENRTGYGPQVAEAILPIADWY
jgi:hypothetical protein